MFLSKLGTTRKGDTWMTLFFIFFTILLHRTPMPKVEHHLVKTLIIWRNFKNVEDIGEGDMKLNGKKLQAPEKSELVSKCHVNGQAVASAFLCFSG